MFNICKQCGQYHADKEIDPAGPYAICPECGKKHLFRQLPLLLVCGPSGGGKTAVLYTLLGKLTAAVLLEGDLLWQPEFNQPENNYRDFYETWLRLAKNINLGGDGRNLVLSAEMFNVFNSGTELNRYRQAQSSAFNRLDEILSPRIVRFGARLTF